MEKKVKKKLLFVGAYPPPYGGIASHLFDLLPQLVENGYEVVSLTPALEDRVFQSSGMKNIFVSLRRHFFKNILAVVFSSVFLFMLKNDLKWKDFLKLLNFSRLIANVIRRESIDIILIYTMDIGLVIPLLRKYIGKYMPVILTIYGAFYLEPDRYKKVSSYISNVFSNCDLILSSSQYCADSVLKILGTHIPIRVVYVGVADHIYIPNGDREQIRNELGIPTSAIVFLFLGRMNSDMGLDFLLRIAKRILSINSDIYIIIAGSKGELSMQAEELANEECKIKYCPNVPFDKKPKLYAACDIFLAPTKERHACMGVSIKEAMASGKPVIASTSGGIPEAISDGVNGYLVPFIDGRLEENTFIERSKRLIHDHKLRTEMGLRGREKASKVFSNETTVQQYLEIIKDIDNNS